MVMAYPSPQQVGREFVRQYYTVLHEAPEYLHRFYSSSSTFVHGGVDRPGHNVEEPVIGQFEIDKKIRSLAFKDCHTKIRQVDAQATVGSAVVVQVTGELSNNGEPMRRFMQTFVLAPQNPKKFYVHNDIFRYQDEVYQDLSDAESEDVHVAVQQSSAQQTSTVSSQPIEVKPAAEVVVETVSADLEHHHAGGDASSSSSSASSQSSDQVAEAATAQPQHDEPHQEEMVVKQQQQTTAAPAAEVSSKDNGPTSGSGGGTKLSSWARIISKDGKTTTEVAPPTQVPAMTYSTNSLPRNSSGSSNKENRGFKQNGANSGAFNGKQTSSSKPRNSASNSSFTGAATNNTSVATATATTTTPTAAPQQPAVQLPVVASRQNGTTGVGSEVDDAQGDDKKFANRYPDTHQVFVGNLNQDLSDAELRDFFGQFGRVVEVRINTNTKQQGGRRLPNYGFVVFDDARAVEKVLSSTKANNLTLRNDRGEFRLNIEEKRARQGRQSSGFGNKSAPHQQRSNRSTSNGSGGQLNGKKPPQFRDEGGAKPTTTAASNTYQRRS